MGETRRRFESMLARCIVLGTCAVIILVGFSAQSAAVTTRQDFTTFAKDAAKLASLRKGVAAMMALDAGVADKDLNGMGWKYQAYIHGVPSTVKSQATWTAEENKVWETCQHSTWFFLSWHRMELYFFERIMRVMAGDATLSIPYWNFGVPAMVAVPPVGARLPPEFRVVMNNSLYWPARNANVNKPPPANPKDPDPAMPLTGADTTTLAAFMQTAFFTNVEDKGPMSFGGGATAITQHGPGDTGTGQIENIPHNAVHTAVGNNTPLSMSNPGGAGLDPIFWPIHVNIDRAWACWQQLHPNTQPTEKGNAWLTEEFSFIDAGGTAARPAPKIVTMTGAQVIAIAAAPLNYMYDNNCAGFQLPPAPKALPAVTSAVEGGRQPVAMSGMAMSGMAMSADKSLSATARFDDILEDKPVVIKVRIPQPMQARIQELARGGVMPGGSVVLSIGGLAIDNTSAAPSYSVFLGLPEGGFPDESGNYYISKLAFFGVGHHRHDDEHQDNGLRFDATDVVQGLIARGEWAGDEVSVTVANTAAFYPDRVTGPPALPEWRARFKSIRLRVQ